MENTPDTAPTAADAKAIKRAGIIAVMAEAGFDAATVQAELKKKGLKIMTKAEVAKYTPAKPVTTADILDQEGPAPVEMSPAPAKPAPKPAKPVKANLADPAAALNAPANVKYQGKDLTVAGATALNIAHTVADILAKLDPAAHAQYKAMKTAGDRAGAYGFALKALLIHTGA